MKSVEINFNKNKTVFQHSNTKHNQYKLSFFSLSSLGKFASKLGFKNPLHYCPILKIRERVYLGISNFICFDLNLSELELTRTCSLITEVKISNIKRA